ncbi:DNA methyltransferase 1-associated protein 1 [Dermatophagoides farinae]|uniref:DNA methyltransferase 1-associated protein 1 n=1 Tax=Dermatophagoides farinae TaxID=6954 RepID=A0A922I883_DERFA|nr:DNA methyltransferase 1-associated protein 1-like [Dermatophagoides farinae]KAH7640627.1 dna methyltransferase 1-associated protein 1-like protein [Dermatophagoides farinae]KAH9526145.1 DNA methyltransferase 1-associated protein 1 [Dermatophagoides farinae]
MSDVRDILELNRESGEKKIVKKKRIPEQSVKKSNIKGMNREVYALLCSENKDSASLIQSDFAIGSKFGFPPFGYKKVKANLSLRKVIKWNWVPFTNPARKDGFQLYHWRREADKNKEYPFAKMNVVINVPSYTDQEYQELLQSNEWNKNETDYLFSLCKKYDLRFIVIQDRWDTSQYKYRTVENIKDRYYSVCDILAKQRNESTVGNSLNVKPQGYVFDAEHERKRKEQLKKLYNRTPEEYEEEQQLIAELRKIEQRKKEREKITQEIQKLISTDSTSELRRQEQQNQARQSNILSRSSRKKTNSQLKGSRISDVGANSFNTVNIESAGIKFPDPKTCGVWLRSSRMKLPSSVGQKRMKAIDQLLKELKVDPHPMPTEEICRDFNDLRSDMVLLYELKMALTNLDFDLQSLKHQYESNNVQVTNEKTAQQLVPTTPLSAVSLPDNLTTTFGSATSHHHTNQSPTKIDDISKKISEVIDVTNSTPRKRKAAMEQGNLMRKLRKN